MSTIVIMPGGFHPFHAGHAALYNSAKRAFPGADVYVAATNDTSSRPFPFAVKEKLAKLAGVDAGHFVQVKSPFRAEEITSRFNPEQDQLIFVRSEKDADKQPLPGGVKKNGEPAYLQPLESAAKLEPFARHAYMAYLPTVEFGPGMTSATEIRTAWPTLSAKHKVALVMSLYPTTQRNRKLAATVVKLLDTAMGVVDESVLSNLPRPNKRNQFKSLHKQRKQRGLDEQGVAEGFFDRFKKQLTAHRGGIDLTASKENDRIIIVATSQGKELGNVIFNANGKILVAAGLGVLPEYQGQGIAEIMYDWAKELGYTVQRSPDQTDAGKGFWDKHKGEEANVWEQGVVEAAKKCPPATQDITLNLNNRQKAIDEYGYGPLNPDLPNTKFWMKKVDEWNLDSMEEAQQSLCGNCAAFDIRQETLDCIAQGIDADSPADAEGVIDAGDLGYCKFLKFKCASRRTCDAWVTGGPLMDKPSVAEMDGQNFVGGMTASYQQRENQPIAEDYIDEQSNR